MVWKRLLNKSLGEADPLSHIGAKIETDFILPYHQELVSIVETKFHLAQADKKLQALVLQYMEHVAVYNAARSAGFSDLHNTQKELLPEWPSDLFPVIEGRTYALQAEYDELLVKYQEA